MLFTLTNKINIQWHNIFGIKSAFFGQEKIWQRLLHEYTIHLKQALLNMISQRLKENLYSHKASRIRLHLSKH